MTSRRREAMSAALPVVVAVGAVGISYGVLAVAAGLPAWQVLLMSAVVFAGSSQFAAVAMIGSGAGTFAAVLSGALLNSRYIAVGAATAPALTGRRWWRALKAQLVVDESFAVGVAAGEGGVPDEHATMTAGVMLWVAWLGGSAVGATLGPVFGDPARFGLDAAFPALFVALLWPMLDRPGAPRMAIGGGLTALVLAPFTPAGIPLAGAAVAGILLSR